MSHLKKGIRTWGSEAWMSCQESSKSLLNVVISHTLFWGDYRWLVLLLSEGTSPRHVEKVEMPSCMDHYVDPLCGVGPAVWTHPETSHPSGFTRLTTSLCVLLGTGCNLPWVGTTAQKSAAKLLNASHLQRKIALKAARGEAHSREAMFAFCWDGGSALEVGAGQRTPTVFFAGVLVRYTSIKFLFSCTPLCLLSYQLQSQCPLNILLKSKQAPLLGAIFSHLSVFRIA